MKKIVMMFLLLAAVAHADEGPYFSPNGGIQKRIIQRINDTKRTLDVAMYDFTAKNIGQAVIAAYRRGVKVRLVLDLRETKTKNTLYPAFVGAGVPVHTMHGIGRGIMHEKIAVFDGAAAFNGSYNWTDNAERNNHEDAYFFTEPAKVQPFEAEFNKLWDGNFGE